MAEIYGKITQGVGGLYLVRIHSIAGEKDSPLIGTTVPCRARGSFRHSNTSPLSGDNVIIDIASEAGEKDGATYVIEKICDRKNSLIRPPLANLDIIFITLAAAAPSPILSTVDKLISIAEFNDIEPVIVITKCELDTEYANKIKNIYEKSGFKVFCLSAAENIGIDPIDDFIRSHLPSHTAAFAGASGIGKSTLLNRLFPDLSLSTSDISKKIQRGKHTTRKVELFPVINPSGTSDCGYISDTPGFSMLDFERFDFFEKDDLVYTMREFRPYIGKCYYKKCSHTKEQGCAIIEAIKQGDIEKSRHQSYCELFDVLKQKTKW